MLLLSIYQVNSTPDTMLAGTDDSANIENSKNTAFIPQLTMGVLLQQQLLHDLGSQDVGSFREGLSTSDGLISSHPITKIAHPGIWTGTETETDANFYGKQWKLKKIPMGQAQHPLPPKKCKIKKNV